MPFLDLEGDDDLIVYIGEGQASLIVHPEVPDPPTGVIMANRWRACFPMPDINDLTLDAYGRPDGSEYVPLTEEISEWGFIQIVVGGTTDVTFYGGVETQLEEWTSEEPLGDGNCTMTFRTISPFVEPPSWLVAYANIDLIATGGINGSGPPIVWEGIISSRHWTDEGLKIECIGSVHQADLYVRAPGFRNEETPIHLLIRDYGLNKTYRPAYRFSTVAFVGPQTSKTSRYRGSWETPANYITKLLEEATDDTGSWSIQVQRPRMPTIALRDVTTEHWHVAWGQPGIDTQLDEEYRRPNVIYGTGEGVSGAEWRGVFFDPEWGGPRIQPLAYDSNVHGYDEVDGSGTLALDIPRRDSTLIRIEEYHGFGQGADRNTAKAAAETYRLRVAEPAYTGSITLTSDPHEGSRFTMKAGDNIRVDNWRGQNPGPLLHISACTVNWASGSVSLTVDSAARNAETVEAIAGHIPDAYDPWLAVLDGRKSTYINDSVAPWDSDAGSGYFPCDITNGFVFYDPTARYVLTGGSWHIMGFLASEFDSVKHTEVHVSPAARYHVGFYNQLIDTAGLPAAPLDGGVWDELAKPTGMQMAYGMRSSQFGAQACGYSPGLESLGSTLTGDLDSTTTWQYNHDDVAEDVNQPMYLWVAIWIEGEEDDEFEMWGRIERGVGN